MGTNKLNKATTLIEVLVSMMIICLTVAGFAATFFWAQSRNVLAQRRLLATDFAREAMEDLLMRDYVTDTALSLGAHTTETFLALPTGCPTCSFKDKLNGSRSYRVDAISDGKKITVTVSWNDELGTQSERLICFIVQKRP